MQIATLTRLHARTPARPHAAALSLILAVVSVLLLSQSAYIWAKAQVAQVLLRVSWERTLAGATAARPWPWADTFPVARLRVARLGTDEIVLAGASGRTMAFGPAHMDGSGMPGEMRNCVVTAHRDTHFAFLRRLQPGDVIEMQDGRGKRWTYHVTRVAVVDRSAMRVAQSGVRSTLTLVTCYPFFAIVPGGPLRYVVTAELVPQPPVAVLYAAREGARPEGSPGRP